MTQAIQSCGPVVRGLYAATLIGGLLATRALWLQWPSAGPWLIGIGAVALVSALLTVWRAAMVLWRRSTLDAPQPEGCVRWLRRLGIAGMAIGALCLLATLMLPWLLANSSAVHTEALGAVGMMAGLFVLVMSAAASGGLMLFELSRLLSFEQALRRANPPAAGPPSGPAPNQVNWRPRSARAAAHAASSQENE